MQGVWIPVYSHYAELFQAGRVFLQRRAGHAGHGFLGQIVVRGPQTAGSDDQITARQGFAQNVFQPPRIVATT